MEMNFFGTEPLQEINKKIDTYNKMIELLSGISFLNGLTVRQYKKVEKLLNEKGNDTIIYNRKKSSRYSNSSIEFYLKDFPNIKVDFNSSYVGGALDIDFRKEIQEKKLGNLTKTVEWYESNKKTIDANRTLMEQVKRTQEELENSYYNFCTKNGLSGYIPIIKSIFR